MGRGGWAREKELKLENVGEALIKEVNKQSSRKNGEGQKSLTVTKNN